MEKKITIIELIKWLINVHICVVILFILCISGEIFPELLLLFFFSSIVSCIIGVILFGYLCFTRRLVISRRAFFLLPHIIFYLLNSFNVTSLFTNPSDILMDLTYVIPEFGLPFLLYCFLQVTDRYFVVAARMFCFVLPLVEIMLFIGVWAPLSI